MSGPGDRAFVRWATRYIPEDDALHVLDAYKKARLVTVDNRHGTFAILNGYACQADALKAAADNLRPTKKKKWNQLTDEERERRVAAKHAVPDQWERQERVELALAKLNLKK